jgi:hypothetical protein
MQVGPDTDMRPVDPPAFARGAGEGCHAVAEGEGGLLGPRASAGQVRAKNVNRSERGCRAGAQRAEADC